MINHNNKIASINSEKKYTKDEIEKIRINRMESICTLLPIILLIPGIIIMHILSKIFSIY